MDAFKFLINLMDSCKDLWTWLTTPLIDDIKGLEGVSTPISLIGLSVIGVILIAKLIHVIIG